MDAKSILAIGALNAGGGYLASQLTMRPPSKHAGLYPNLKSKDKNYHMGAINKKCLQTYCR